MKAVLCTGYGKPEDVLKLGEIEKPQPKENQILVKIYASVVSSGDARMRRADPYMMRFFFGFGRPKKPVFGYVVAGVIEAIGSGVSKFKVGDQIFGTTGMGFGAHAEYQCISEDGTLALMPNNMTYEEAAAIPFGATASLHFLRKAQITPGQKVLIYGASGSLGIAGIQLAKSFGAEVTAVCSGKNEALVKSVGADHVIDYRTKDFSESSERYDVIYETVGKSSYRKITSVLKDRGILLQGAADLSRMFKGGMTSLFTSKKVISGVVKSSAEDMNLFKELIEEGSMTSVIDSVHSLENIVKAHAIVDSGHKKGSVVIKVR